MSRLRPKANAGLTSESSCIDAVDVAGLLGGGPNVPSGQLRTWPGRQLHGTSAQLWTPSAVTSAVRCEVSCRPPCSAPAAQLQKIHGPAPTTGML